MSLDLDKLRALVTGSDGHEDSWRWRRWTMDTKSTELVVNALPELLDLAEAVRELGRTRSALDRVIEMNVDEVGYWEAYDAASPAWVAAQCRLNDIARKLAEGT